MDLKQYDVKIKGLEKQLQALKKKREAAFIKTILSQTKILETLTKYVTSQNKKQ